MSTRPTPGRLETPAANAVNAETVAVPGTGDSAPAPATSAEPSRPANASLVGVSFDDYEVLQELGRGGMGVVYKARQKSLDRLVALKMLLGQYFDDPVRLARFRTEARASASLNHPNIVQVYHVGESPYGHYFAMELIEGQPLEAYLAKGKMSLASALSLVSVVADAVHYAHSRDIVHRDLKPANIMIDSARRPVIMDFGIAKLLGQSSSLTQQGVVMGTPAYMAPEQAGENHDLVGPHSDVYALTAILYTLLTGRPPFEEATPLKTVLKVIGPDMPPPVRSLRPDAPEILEKVCVKGLAKSPADRYPSAHALADHLRRIRAALKIDPGDRKGPASGKASVPSVVLVTAATGKQVRLFGPRTLIGRGAECDVVLKSADVSKQHCQILINADGVVVEDLQSANGIQVNGKRVQRAVLKDGDRLTVVRYEFEVRLR